MTTLTQRKKGWWKIWLLIGVVVAVFAIIGVLAILPNADGNPYLDLTPVQNGYLSAFMWASDAVVNALILSVGFAALGGFFVWLYYNYLRGQKVTTQPQNAGYNPQPTTPSQPQSGTETVIS